MTDELFAAVFPNVRIDASKRALDRWGTTRSGVMHAVPTGGKLTGKGAGSLSRLYSGCFVVDDPIKPKDAYSNAVREDVNDRFDNTFMSRLANDGFMNDESGNEIRCNRTPMIIIMQRVHDEDLVGYLFRGKSSDKYYWLNIPALLEGSFVGSKDWYQGIMESQNYSHAIPITFALNRPAYPTALWPARKNLESLLSMKEASPYTFYSQYMGEPTAKGTGLIQEDWYNTYAELPKESIIQTFLTADTASTAKNYSDFSVVCLWHKTKSGELYLGDVELGKWETPELKKVLVEFWKKHNKVNAQFPCLMPTALYMEDKSSGQFLNQQFQRDGEIRVLPIPKDRSSGDKVARFLNAVPYFAQGRMFFPDNHKHSIHVRREVMNMSGLGSGTGHDDVVDNISDAVVIAFSAPTANYLAWVD